MDGQGDGGYWEIDMFAVGFVKSIIIYMGSNIRVLMCGCSCISVHGARRSMI